MTNLSFAQPWFFLLLLLLIPMYYCERRSKVSIGFSPLKNFSEQSFVINWLFVLRVLMVILLIVALARPRLGRTEGERKTEGLDIILAIDASESMIGHDLQLKGRPTDRLSVVKSVVGDFIEKRFDDRIGLVVFGEQAYALSPLTLDHEVLKTHLEGLEIGMAGGSTAIGDALGVSINSIKDVKGKSKIIILLTDGKNNAGKHDPMKIAQVAKAISAKIYTIGVGSNRPVPVPTAFGFRHYPMSFDENLLKKIARETGARYYKAENTETLVSIYESIDKLEKSEVKLKVYRRYDEKYGFVLGLAFILLLTELLLSLTPLRRIP